MRLKIENIGIISNTEINIDGLTVITGLNNTGKSMIGKALYSLIAPAIYFKDDAINDICNYIRDEIEDKLINMFGFEHQVFRFGSRFSNLIEIANALKILITDFEKFAKSNTIKNKISVESFINKLQSLLSYVQSDDILDKYLNEISLAQINEEFNNQVTPLNKEHLTSMISIENDGGSILSYKMSQEGFTRTQNKVVPFGNVFLIGNAFILDELEENRCRQNEKRNHKKRLVNAISLDDDNKFKEMRFHDQAKELFDLINAQIPEPIFVYKNRYVYSNKKLNIKNLSTGSKMFAIIKMLLMKGLLNCESLIILDEPEIHLHPEWQTKFAEILVLLNKMLGVKVLLTTHSPNFVLAIDVYKAKHQIKTDFYRSILNHQSVQFENVNDKINVVYRKMLDPFLILESMKESVDDE